MATSKRRLSAILHADLAGFVRMMEGEENRTFRQLKSAQAEVLRPAIEIAGGSLVNSTGDSILAEFGSVFAAVAAAVNIQEHMARFNDTLDREQRMMFRIGVHLGEVIVDEEERNIFGDCVNLAERIQGLAEPGGIAVSCTVREVTELQVDYSFVDGGKHRAKNVSRPLHIYHVRARESALDSTRTSALPQATLRLHGADLTGRKFGFDLCIDRLIKKQKGFVIGRDFGQCDVVLSHPTVSRRHARLLLVGNALHIKDMGSTNGTSVDGTVVIPGILRRLQPGARLKIGDIELAGQFD
jgi:class 3 adenylate cyclase